MKKGFSTIMSAQFFSSLADNALFVTALTVLRVGGAPEWERTALIPMFALFYVILAPFLGPIADAFPKGRVMFVSNLIKVVGCVMMLLGVHPLLSIALVGLGAAAYSPAKYGILTELLPNSQLVKANGWIEGLTIASIILGSVVGGQLTEPTISALLMKIDLPWVETGLDSPTELAIATLILLYAIAAAFNLRIPRTEAVLQPLNYQPLQVIKEFNQCNMLLWRDKLGQISLATTTLFWGVSGNMRYIVLAWAAAVFGFTEGPASALVGVVAIGTAAGAVVAAMRMRLDQAYKVVPLGIIMGVSVILMNFITDVWVAVPFLVLLGAVGGFLVVPMNALLQHRGHNLMGAGRSIAVQNFNEQACILGMGALYTGVTGLGLSAFHSITIFGLVVAVTSWVIQQWHKRNSLNHPEEVERLLALARSDSHT
ncbi:MAG: lysophospholipid transporter LplT [Pseudomonadota bacterium]